MTDKARKAIDVAYDGRPVHRDLSLSRRTVFTGGALFVGGVAAGTGLASLFGDAVAPANAYNTPVGRKPTSPVGGQCSSGNFSGTALSRSDEVRPCAGGTGRSGKTKEATSISRFAGSDTGDVFRFGATVGILAKQLPLSEVPAKQQDACGLEAGAIDEQVDRICKSPEFAANQRRKAFLRFVVAETLAGRADRLKGYTIALSVFDRNESFDAQNDPVVRLEARRLRRELEHYYLTDGVRDPVIITMPKGAYAPAFEMRTRDEPMVAEDDPAAHQPPEPAQRTRPVHHGIVLAVAVAAVLSIGGALAYRGVLLQRPDMPTETSRLVSKGLPVIAVMPFEAPDDSVLVRQAVTGLAEDIVTDLSRIQAVRVISHASTSRPGGDQMGMAELGTMLGATHVLRGSLQTDEDRYRFNASLVDVTSHQHIWAGRFDYTADGRFETQSNIAHQIAEVLSIKLLPEQSMRLEKGRLKQQDAEDLYKQALSIVHPPSDQVRVEAAIALLQRVAEIEPDAAHGHGGLAFVEAHRVWYGHVPNSREAHLKIEQHASAALSIDPANARALIARSVSAMNTGDSEKSVAFARRAVTAQPSSAYANAYLGVALIFAGQPAQAIASIQTAMQLDPANPRRPYLNILAVAHFHSGNFEEAAQTFDDVLRSRGPYGPAMMTYHAASLGALRQEQEESEVLQQLKTAISRSDAFSVEGWLRRATSRTDYIKPMLDELAKAKRLQ